MLIFRALRGTASDDAFITYRYAYNLASGVGLVYNPGERVLSTTTPLLALTLGGLGFVWQQLLNIVNGSRLEGVGILPGLFDFIPLAAALLGSLGLAAGGWLIWEIGQTSIASATDAGDPDLALAWRAAGWAGLLIFPTFPLLLGTIEMEMPIYLAFCLGAVAAYLRRRWCLAAAAAALACLTRPDGLLLAALLAADYLWQRNRITSTRPAEAPPVQAAFQHFPWKAIAIFLALGLPWVFFAWLYFGSPIPVTLIAKQNQGMTKYATSYHFLQRLLFWGQRYTAAFWWFIPQLVLVALGLGRILFKPAKVAPAWRLINLWALLFATSYQLLGVSSYFWYYAPLIPAWVLNLAIGVVVFIELLRHLRVNLSDRTAAIITVALLGILAAGQVHSRIPTRLSESPAYGAYRAIGQWLRENTPPSAQVGALEVGILGYYSQRYIVDFAGLIQPATSSFLVRAEDWRAAILAALEEYHPEYVVIVGEYKDWQAQAGMQTCTLLQTHPIPASTVNLYYCPTQ